MSILTDSRLELTAAISGLGVKVYDFVPAVPVPPCIVVIPAETWITPGRIANRLNIRVDWKVTAVVAPRKNNAATLDLETLACDILDALPAGYQLVRAGAPQILDLGAQGNAYSLDINVTAELKD